MCRGNRILACREEETFAGEKKVRKCVRVEHDTFRRQKSLGYRENIQNLIEKNLRVQKTMLCVRAHSRFLYEDRKPLKGRHS